MDSTKNEAARGASRSDDLLGLPEKLRAYVNDNGDWAAGLSTEDVLAAADRLDLLHSALAELVELKDMKARFENWRHASPKERDALHLLEQDYNRRKLAAWTAARAALVPNK